MEIKTLLFFDTEMTTESSETLSGRMSGNYTQTTTDELFIVDSEKGKVMSHFS